MKKILICLMAVLLIFSMEIPSLAGTCGWYVMRVKEHKQPSAPTELAYILQYDGYYVDQKHGDEDTDKVIYLTFDAGYENGNVAKILDILAKEEVPAAFFILGHLIKSAPDLVARMEAEGHLVCNHSVRHKDMSCLDAAEFEREIYGLEDMYTEATGKSLAKFFRPPEGKFNEETLKRAKDCGYKTVFWSLTYADWDARHAPSPEKAKALLRDNTHNGAILLLHPMADINVQILPEMIAYWRAEGYSFGCLTDL